MVFIPFIFFVFLTLFLAIKSKRVSVSVYMAGLFAITSFFAILIVKMGLLGDAGILFKTENLHLGIVPTLLYCLLITLAIIPFSRIDDLKNKDVSAGSDRLFVGFCVFLLLLAALNFYLASDSILSLCKNGIWLGENKYTKNGYPGYSGFWEIRSAHYNGMKSPSDIRLERLPKVFGYIYYLHNCTILLVPCLFYALCCAKKKWWFNLMLFAGSISVPFLSIQRADRTEIINYVLMFVFCVVLFWHHIRKRQWIFMGLVLVPVVIMAVVYMVGVTKARFHTENNGEINGIVQYSGQSYLNFCYIYENDAIDTVYTERVFPMVNHFLGNNDYDFQAIEKRNAMHGFKTDVFSSFIGIFLLDFGKVTMWLYVLAFSAFCILLFKKKENVVSFWNLLMVFVLAEVPVFGIFYYRYYYYDLAMVFWMASAFYLISMKDKLKGKFLRKE